MQLKVHRVSSAGDTIVASVDSGDCNIYAREHRRGVRRVRAACVGAAHFIVERASRERRAHAKLRHVTRGERSDTAMHASERRGFTSVARGVQLRIGCRGLAIGPRCIAARGVHRVIAAPRASAPTRMTDAGLPPSPAKGVASGVSLYIITGVRDPEPSQGPAHVRPYAAPDAGSSPDPEPHLGVGHAADTGGDRAGARIQVGQCGGRASARAAAQGRDRPDSWRFARHPAQGHDSRAVRPASHRPRGRGSAHPGRGTHRRPLPDRSGPVPAASRTTCSRSPA